MPLVSVLLTSLSPIHFAFTSLSLYLSPSPHLRFTNIRFLDIAAGVKELHLSNAFSDVVAKLQPGVQGGGNASNTSANNLGNSSPTPGCDDKRHAGSNIPVEKSGGGV